MEKPFVNGIIKSINEFRDNPFRYFYESDIRSMMYNNLKSEYSEDITLNVREDYWGKNEIKISQVVTEYFYKFKEEDGKRKKSGKRIDIAVLNKEEIKTKQDIDKYFINEPCHTDSNWEQPVKYGIEIKFSSGNYKPSLVRLENEIFKLKDYYCGYAETKRLKGVAICFCHIKSSFQKDDYTLINDTEHVRKILEAPELTYISIIIMGDEVFVNEYT